MASSLTVRRPHVAADDALIQEAIRLYLRRGRQMVPASAERSQVVTRNRTRFVAVFDERGYLLVVYEVQENTKPGRAAADSWQLAERTELSKPPRRME